MSAAGIELITRNSLSSLRHRTSNDSAPPEDERNWSRGFLRQQFRVKSLEELYSQYQERLQYGYFSVFLLLQTTLCVCHVAVLCGLVGQQTLPDVLTYVIVLVLCCPPVLLVYYTRRYPWVPLLASCVVLVVLVAADLGLPLYHATTGQDAPTVRPAYTTHTLLACYMFVPLTLDMQAFTLGITVTLCHLVSLAMVVYRNYNDMYTRLASDMVYLLCVNGMGLYFRFMNEVAIRRTFLDRRACVEGTYKVQYEKQQEEQLMLSILPRHIIDVVREDIQKVFLHFNKPTRKKPFSDMYVKEHNDVTILYADVVNYSKLTESLPVIKLVETLNELFGRFDEASEERGVLRIKFLGDCYYCVSGIPEKNPQHAKNCVDLGLDMIAIIKDVREERRLQQDLMLDMRIGIHSGQILSGLLGVCKWQYDVWSRDVIIANHMEQAGRPGQVHVTKETLKLLQNGYRFEPGHGAQRDSLLAKYNIETFFIRPVHHKTSIPNVDERNLYYRRVSTGPRRHTGGANKGQLRRNTVDGLAVGSRRRMVFMDDNLLKYQQTLRMADAQMAKAIQNMHVGVYDRWRFRENINPICLTFDDVRWEVPFLMQPDPLFKFYVSCAFGVLLCVFVIQLINLPSGHWLAWAGLGSALALVVLLVPLTWTHFLWTKLRDPHRELDHVGQPRNLLLRFLFRTSLCIVWQAWIRILIYVVVCLSIGACAILELVNCDATVENISTNYTLSITSAALGEIHWAHKCLAPWHITQKCSLAIIMSFLFLRIHFQLKLILECLIVGIYSWGIWSLNPKVFTHGETWNPGLEPRVAHVLSVVFLTLTMNLLDRQTEYMSRLDYKWKRQLAKEQDQASTTHMVNKMLLQNILPVHVADLYLNTNRTYEDLYHEEYDTVAVMFASLTEYTIYDDENQEGGGGLTQLSSLKIFNQIICDFDKLLFEPGFLRVEKIKVAGWTYMAACGLDPGRRDSTTSSVKQENFQEHVVVVLARFAAAMMQALRANNRETLQTFELRIGISHGKVTAGVVGAQKPLYDIWGYAVNMAARMDTTGEPGKLQVTENTAAILQARRIRCECRGLTQVKNKGLVMTYFVCLDKDFNLIQVEDNINQTILVIEDEEGRKKEKVKFENCIEHKKCIDTKL